jgi:hypothetical protein
MSAQAQAPKEQLYKWLNEDGRPCHGGAGRWHLPEGDAPGAWMPAIRGALIPCERGYHLCRAEDLLNWIGPALFEAEADGERITHGHVRNGDSKLVVGRARLTRRVAAWDKRAMRLLACDCAERALTIYERQAPEDNRPREAIAVARRSASGEASHEELDAAGAARAAAGAARAAAGAAAGDAAGAAAGAARAAAWDAERSWQSDRLLRYARGEVA